MASASVVELTQPFREEAEADMRRLGLDPGSSDDWKAYALLVVRDRKLLHGMPSPHDEEIIEISKTAHARLMRVAGPMSRVIVKLKEVEEDYLKIKEPSQRDVLEHAIALLILLDDGLVGFRVSPLGWGGLPTPLRLVQADLVNVLEGRLGRLVSPDDGVVDSAHYVADSSNDRVRVTIQAYAAAVVDRLIASGKMASKEDAYREVACALGKAGFRPPGKPTEPYSYEAVRSWYTGAQKGTAAFAREYGEALKGAEAEPQDLLMQLQRAARSLMFRRGVREETL